MLHGGLDGLVRAARQPNRASESSVFRVPEVGVKGLDGLPQGVGIHLGPRGSSSWPTCGCREGLSRFGSSPWWSSVEVEGPADGDDQLRGVTTRLRLAASSSIGYELDVLGTGGLRTLFTNAESLVWMRHGFRTGSPARSRRP